MLTKVPTPLVEVPMVRPIPTPPFGVRARVSVEVAHFEVEPPELDERQTPSIAKQPSVISIPFAKVEVATPDTVIPFVEERPPTETPPVKEEVAVPVTPRRVVVAVVKLAFVAARLVEEAVVAKSEVVVAPVRVSTEKTDDDAAFRMLKARPFAGDVWMVVVP